MLATIEKQCYSCLDYIPIGAQACRFCGAKVQQEKTLIPEIQKNYERAGWIFLIAMMLGFYWQFISDRNNDFSTNRLIALCFLILISIIAVRIFERHIFEDQNIYKLLRMKNDSKKYIIYARRFLIGMVLFNLLMTSLFIGKQNVDDFNVHRQQQDDFKPYQIIHEDFNNFGSMHRIIEDENYFVYMGAWGKYFKIYSMPLEVIYAEMETDNIDDLRIKMEAKLSR